MKLKIIQTFLVGLITIIFAACNQANNDKVDEADTTKQVVTQVLTSTNSDTLFVDQTCAVFVSADSMQIEKRN